MSYGNINVTKASGEQEVFSDEKLIFSIKRAKIPPELEQKVLEHVKSKLYDNIPTHEVYKHITEFLGASSHPFSSAKYSLKQSIMDLGPTGYPFEDYISRLFEARGYTTQTRQILRGKCITHEIDVIAEKHTVLENKIMVEAKFHNQVGIRTDVHVAMYTKARFDDVKDKNRFTECWLVTNTKASIDAIAYANCVRMNLVAWSYPEGDCLRDWIERLHMYPITALTTLTHEQKQQLLEKSIVVTGEIYADHSKLDVLNLSKEMKIKVLQEINFISNHSEDKE